MKRITAKHSNGYSGALYGEKSMVIYDSDGNMCLHTCFRNINTEEELMESLEEMPKLMEIIKKEFEEWEQRD